MKSQPIKIPAFGHSMYPFFISGDILSIQPISLANIKVNDFITFVQKNVFITHRVIYIPLHKKYILLKGDANQKADKKILPKNIIGKVIKIERNGKIFSPNTLYQLQSSAYNKEVNEINILFQKKKINFVFLKGLPLYLYYEHAIPSRIYGDCDIMIQKDQLPFVNILLTQNGYIKEENQYSFFHKLLKNKETELTYLKTVKKIPINLDIHVEPSFMMHQLGSLDALYSEKLLTSFSCDILTQKRMINVSGKQYPILASHHLIIYLALHLFHHNLQGYYRYEFLRMVLKKEHINSTQIVSVAAFYKLTSFIYPVFWFLWKYYSDLYAKTIIDAIQLSPVIEKTLIKQIITIDIFADATRIKAGIQRFKLIFFFSPNSMIRKMTIVFSLPILYSIAWVILKKVQLQFIFLKVFFRQYGNLLLLRILKKQSV